MGVLLTGSTSRNAERQKEQLAAFALPPLTDAQVAAIAEAGTGRFYRKFMHEMWDGAKP